MCFIFWYVWHAITTVLNHLFYPTSGISYLLNIHSYVFFSVRHDINNKVQKMLLFSIIALYNCIDFYRNKQRKIQQSGKFILKKIASEVGTWKPTMLLRVLGSQIVFRTFFHNLAVGLLRNQNCILTGHNWHGESSNSCQPFPHSSGPGAYRNLDEHRVPEYTRVFLLTQMSGNSCTSTGYCMTLSEFCPTANKHSCSDYIQESFMGWKDKVENK